MPAKESERFSPEVWSLVGNPIPKNLIDTYMRYVDSLPPHERRARMQIPNPNNGHLDEADLRAHLEERTPAGLYVALTIYNSTLEEMTIEKRDEALENPQVLIEATIRRLQEATPDPNSSPYF